MTIEFLRILTVDPDTARAHARAAPLVGAGHVVAMAATAEAALEEARRGAPDLVLLAAAIGASVSGLVARLRAMPQTAESAILVLGDDAPETVRRAAREAGADGCLATLPAEDTLAAWAGALARQTARARRAQRMARMGSWSLDVASGRLVWSDVTCALFGIRPAEFRGTFEHFASFVLPEDRCRLDAAHRQAVATRGALEAEYRIRRPDGEVRWMFERGHLEFDDAGQVVRRLGMVMDITERKLAEQRILRLNRVHALLSAINNAIVHLRDRQALFEQACRIAVETGGLRAAWIGTVEPDGEVSVAAQAGAVDAYLRHIRVTTAPVAEGHGPFGLAVRENRAAVCNHIARDPMFAPWREQALRHGFQACAAFPLHVDGLPIGGFALYADVEDYFDDEEIRLFEQLASDISFAIAFIDQEQRRRLAEAALRESEERFRLLSKATNDAIWDWNLADDVLWWSEGFETLFGLRRDDVPPTFQGWAGRIHPDDRDRVVADIYQAVLTRGEKWSDSYRFLRRDGTYAHVHDRGYVIRDAEGRATRMVGGMTDVTERRTLEERLLQAQRLEAIGQLTGGVAHDFNNLLTVILGNADMLAEEVGDQRWSPLIALIADAAQRGADLTRQLLAYARRQPLDPKSVDVNRLVAEMDALLRRALGEHIEVELVRAAGLWSALVDPAQLESALLNLAINARDAMPNGGRLTIETANVWINDDYAGQHVDVKPGQYVLLAVSDTGVGIAAEHLDRVFEPFFTTKPKGIGTGLGLAMVYGFAKQSGGHVNIYSEPGQGTTVRMYLPRSHAPAEARRDAAAAVVGGSETILLVEDDAQVRAYAREQLVSLGYTVLDAADAREALAMAERRADIDLLFTDVVMPGGMSGKQLADAVRALRPRIKVLYTSGYTDNAIVHHGRLDAGVHLLTKPYRRAELARKVRAILDT
ncbi:hypothetical protein MBSD_n0225 [Mizugakiibacter sediminis]|uniref:histidine kinase n=1 Tax=Mizugakiibacter sediminis TaxID=1475481 RepID=A0A0K8QKC8_9GAMM|nr:PAS domain-containing protein [Mizugakiibacter sediminis]GAP64942.1 hypothetical protein MBSD_n0225 [Mizugakiibacter sediminis]